MASRVSCGRTLVGRSSASPPASRRRGATDQGPEAGRLRLRLSVVLATEAVSSLFAPTARGVCPCAVKSQAGRATRNSLCVTDRSGDRSGDRILDCGLTPEQPLACEKALEGVGTLWSCDGLEAYLRDVNNCGSCGHKCPRKNYVCDAGKCVDCNNGCGDDKVYCGNFKSCCALSPANGVDVTTCYTSPDDPAPGCSASGYQVPRRPGTSSCFP